MLNVQFTYFIFIIKKEIFINIENSFQHVQQNVILFYFIHVERLRLYCFSEQPTFFSTNKTFVIWFSWKLDERSSMLNEKWTGINLAANLTEFCLQKMTDNCWLFMRLLCGLICGRKAQKIGTEFKFIKFFKQTSKIS